MNASNLMLISGLVALLVVHHAVRGRQRHTLGWLIVATLLLCGIFPSGIIQLAESAHLRHSSAVLFVALAAIYCFALFVSMMFIHQYRRNVRLMQELAILSRRMRTLEKDATQTPVNGSDD